MAIAILKLCFALFIVFHFGQANSQNSAVSFPKKNGRFVLNYYNVFNKKSVATKAILERILARLKKLEKKAQFGQGQRNGTQNSTVSFPKKNGRVVVTVNNYYKSAEMKAVLEKIAARLKKIEKKVLNNRGQTPCKCTAKPKNCVEVLKCGGKASGVYSIDPDGSGSFKVYCDQNETSGGGWAVFQRRQDGSVNFYRGWNDYKRGFGNLTGEFWLGLHQIHRLTQQKNNTLRVDLEDWKGNEVYAEYDSFAVTSERNKYRLSLGTYSGTAGDSLGPQRGYPFTTKDRDNDTSGHNCASLRSGAWWYRACSPSNLNGPYRHGNTGSSRYGMHWVKWKGWHYSVKRTEMKIRPV